MKFNFAHIRHPSTSGGSIDFAVFEARSTTGSASDNSQVLANLTSKAREGGRKIDQSALAFNEHGRLKFYGTKTLVDYLAKHGLPQWTHSISL
jgi:hypothetical protein